MLKARRGVGVSVGATYTCVRNTWVVARWCTLLCCASRRCCVGRRTLRSCSVGIFSATVDGQCVYAYSCTRAAAAAPSSHALSPSSAAVLHATHARNLLPRPRVRALVEASSTALRYERSWAVKCRQPSHLP